MPTLPAGSVELFAWGREGDRAVAAGAVAVAGTMAGWTAFPELAAMVRRTPVRRDLAPLDQVQVPGARVTEGANDTAICIYRVGLNDSAYELIFEVFASK